MSESRKDGNHDITVVITCFNYGAYLPDAVSSALNQEGGAPNVIVVDDGSTDEPTLEAFERLPTETSLIRQSNAGLAAARNAGFRVANTPYLIALDADDRLTPTALTMLRRPLDRDPQLGFSYGVAQFFGDWEGTLDFPAFDPYKLLYRHIVGSTTLMRRSLFEQVGGFDPSFSAYEDWEFWVNAMGHGWRGKEIEAITLMYRRHGRTMYNDARARYRFWYRQLREKHPELYARAGRKRFAAESDMGPLGRGVYRWWWGARPLPAQVEGLLYKLLWRPRSGTAT
jgi:glycosyltransferase involved in cell wall biosynthesis